MKVAVTDYTFDSLDVERGILEPMGCEIAGPYAKDDPDSLPVLVADADCVIAPVRADRRPGHRARWGGASAGDRPLLASGSITSTWPATRGTGASPVCNVPDYCIDEVAEDHTLGLMLALTRAAQRAPRPGPGRPVRGRRAPWSRCTRLKSRTVGVVGFGRIGRAVADRLKAFRCMTIVFDPLVSDREIEQTGCLPVTFDRVVGSPRTSSFAALPIQPPDATDDRRGGPGRS